MSTLKSRVAYLHGLIDGLGISGETKEGRVIAEMSSILEDMADRLEELEEVQYDMEEYLDALSDDLNDVEDDFYEDDDDDEDEYAQYEDTDDDFVDVLCPHCNETVYYDKGMFDNNSDIRCPNCHSDIVMDCTECDDEFND
jgi:DNA-directed RNA polymerase subunit delta